MAPKKGGPPKWPTCEFCQKKFSPASIAIHQEQCRDRPDRAAEQAAIEELAKIEGPRPANPNADWQPCPNCGELYGEFALAPHTRRCKRLLPHGKKKDGVQYGSGPPPEKGLFEKMLSGPEDYGCGLSQEELARLRKIFDRFDKDK